MTDVNSVVKQSDDIGVQLDNAILDPTATKSKLVATVSSLAKSQSEVAASAAKLHDTGRLRGLQSWLDTVMNYRTQGLEGMSAALDDGTVDESGRRDEGPAGLERLPAAARERRPLLRQLPAAGDGGAPEGERQRRLAQQLPVRAEPALHGPTDPCA